MNKKLVSGTLHMVLENGNNIPLADIQNCELEYETEDYISRIFTSGITSVAEVAFTCNVLPQDMCSLILGRRATNNWLKMHGGVMRRKCMKKKC